MSKRLKMTILILALVAVGVGLTLYFSPPSEPIYQGRRLTEWLDDSRNGTPQAQKAAGEAVSHIGSNAVPTLVRMLRLKEDSRRYLWLRHFVLGHSRLGESIPKNSARRNEALRACQFLGPAAHGAMPALMELANQPNTAFDAAGALEAIGPDGVRAVSQCLTNPNSAIRLDLVKVLGRQAGLTAEIAQPALLASLEDRDRAVSNWAASSLKRMGRESATK